MKAMSESHINLSVSLNSCLGAIDSQMQDLRAVELKRRNVDLQELTKEKRAAQ